MWNFLECPMVSSSSKTYRIYSMKSHHTKSYNILCQLFHSIILVCNICSNFHCNLILFLLTELQSLRIYLPENSETCIVHNRAAIIFWHGRLYFPRTTTAVYNLPACALHDMSVFLPSKDSVHAFSPWTWRTFINCPVTKLWQKWHRAILD